MSKHPYQVTCSCKRCVREAARRGRQAVASALKSYKAPKNARRRSRADSPATARYIDPLDQGDNLGESPDY